MNAEYVCIAVPHIDLDTGLINTDYLPRERVVRCRDCKYAEGDTRCTRFYEADQDGYGNYPADICPDGFCVWGEPR